MPLNARQKEAVEYLDGPLLVLAGPGTGKTQLLSSKVAYILENTDTNPENILCITFTESGASNMRDRLKSIIGTKAASRVNIHTYHAFGSDIIAQYKNYALNFDRNLDEPIDTVTQHKLIREIQKSLPASDILRNSPTADILETIENAKSARLSSGDLLKIANDNIKTSDKLNEELSPLLDNLVPRMKFDDAVAKVYRPILEVFATFSSQTPLSPGIEKEANIYLRELNDIITSESAKEKPSVSVLTKWKTKRFEKDGLENYRLKNRIANKKLFSLAGIMKSYEARLAEEGLFDFSDMIQQAIKILDTDTGFCATLREKYQYILLDEFQDTNAAQAELIAKLTDRENTMIMAVGDDDQAIFAFQGADVSNMVDFQNYYNAKVITLVENYRSTAEILDLSYQIRKQISDSFAKKNHIEKRLIAMRDRARGDTEDGLGIGTRGGATGGTPDARSRETSTVGEAVATGPRSESDLASATGPRSVSQISRHEFLESSAEYSWLASEIARLVRSGVPQSNIAIITPRHKYVQPLLPFLKSYENIFIAYEKRDNIFEDERIHELILLARFAHELSAEKQPSHRLLEILSFPFWEVSPLSVINAINRARTDKKSALDYLTESKDEKLRQISEFLAALALKSFSSPLELFLDYLTGSVELNGFRSPFLAYYARENDKFSAFNLYESLSVLREAVIKHARSKTPKLGDFIEFLDDYEAADQPLMSTSPYQDASDAVQILTAHKSKGLEFEYVFLVATDDLAWGNAKGNNNLLSLPANLIQIRHTGVTEDERIRLFFVAVTRAKSHLIMTNSIADFDGKHPARLEYLEETEVDGQISSPFIPSKIVEKHYDYTSADMNLASLQTSWIANYSKIDGQIRPVLEKRMENYKITATDLTTFIDIAYAGPQVFYERKVLLAPDESYSENLTFGNLIHAVFEKVTSDKLDDDKALDFFHEQVALAAIPEEDREYILEKGTESIKETLKSFGKLLRAPSGRAEVNLYQEHPVLGDIPLTGKIDHIDIDEKAKTIEIYDFKTGNYKDYGWGNNATLYKYSLQLGFYKLLLNKSPSFSKYKVTRAHILFVTPDAGTGKVHDKVYEFNEKDELQLQSLVKVVYNHAHSLDFVENPELFLAPDSKKTIKDIKDFIALLLDEG